MCEGCPDANSMQEDSTCHVACALAYWDGRDSESGPHLRRLCPQRLGAFRWSTLAVCVRTCSLGDESSASWS
eukprot:COSAG06_NODE_61455_length_267_cov_1.547619_1_plen_71_part_10